MNVLLLIAAGALLFKSLQGGSGSGDGLFGMTLRGFAVGDRVLVYPRAMPNGKWPDGSKATEAAIARITAKGSAPFTWTVRTERGAVTMTVKDSDLAFTNEE